MVEFIEVQSPCAVWKKSWPFYMLAFEGMTEQHLRYLTDGNVNRPWQDYTWASWHCPSSLEYSDIIFKSKVAGKFFFHTCNNHYPWNNITNNGDIYLRNHRTGKVLERRTGHYGFNSFDYICRPGVEYDIVSLWYSCSQFGFFSDFRPVLVKDENFIKSFDSSDWFVL